MEFYISMALAILFQVMKDTGLYTRYRPAFIKLKNAIEMQEASEALQLNLEPKVGEKKT